ncbi:MAG: NUDIX domain-containing protein [Candidatus Shapirobacteria bacterium]
MVNNYNANNSDRGKELLWEVNDNDEVVGSISREECHNETRKPWHRSTHVYLFDSKGNLYLSQRSFSKDTAAGKWTVSAGGHVKYGDEPLVTAQRELEEELGVKVNLTLIDKIKIDYGSEKEIISIFAGVNSDKIRHNPNEVNQVKIFNYEEVTKNFMSGKFDLSGGSRDSFRWVLNNGTLGKFRETI